MIDKTIPYFNVIMRYDGPPVNTPPEAPNGYKFRGFRIGDEQTWARMEVDNNDFDTYENAVKYFTNKYCSTPEKLNDRFVGIENAKGELCGAIICWEDNRNSQSVSSVHWLVTSPKEQGKGLGSALVRMLIYKFSIMGSLPIYLHTQPWSYIAIGIYSKLGFRLLTEDTFRGYENQSAQALPILMELMKYDQFKKLNVEMI